ncbi:Acg family FMN-binding oxidoreductase [Streptomyces sp. NPDC057616]|uniref:Acg family FMN-binding oxidoreductase n=1 Tax=Streptomyces sp. NPDC057616 TaxID=3346183 RepID=UPI0036B39870
MSVIHDKPGRAALHLARAASLAPSPHNCQPWFFVEEGDDRGFEVHLDDGRRMVLTDPYGREAVIACGAALFNVRIAVRHLGFRPVVDLLPDPGDSHHLARVGYAAHAPSTPDEALLVRGMNSRYTHRGRFGAAPVPDELLADLHEQARVEGATLQIVDDPEQLALLAGLVRTAEDTHRADLGHATELARCVGPYGMPVEACRHHPDTTLLAGREYLPRAGRRRVSARSRTAGTGTVVILSTPHDRRTDWLRSGQALQRMLLHAAAHDVMAAFHTQPLELPALRARLRTDVTAGRYPQIVLRLGQVPQRPAWCTPRRPPVQVLARDDAPARWSP